MLSSIHILGFKGFKDTRIEPIRKVNLILGGQNVGKTSLLEAVYLGASSVEKISQLPSIFRVAEGGDAIRYFQSVLGRTRRNFELEDSVGRVVRTNVNDPSGRRGFFDLDSLTANDIQFRRQVKGPNVKSPEQIVFASIADQKQRGVTPQHAIREVAFLNPLTVSVHLPTQLVVVQLFDRAVMSRKKRKLLDMLTRIEPRLEDMHSLSPDGEQRIYVELAGEGDALPLPLLGHGFSRLVHLYCSLLVSDAKLALIDEVENGIHYSSLPTLFQGIQDIAANNGVQTMMTTHSWECIRAAYNIFASAGRLDDFQLIRLERNGDNIRAVVINDEQLVAAMEAGYEIR